MGALTAQSSENIYRHHYTRLGSETKNYGSSVMAGGGVTLAALGGDLTLAGSGVTAGTDALLQAKGNIALKEVTDHSYNYLRTVSHGFLSKKTITQSKDTTTENGSLIAANDNIAVMSGGNFSVAGSLEAQKNIALNSGGDLTVTALKNTENTYYQKKKSGLFASTSGGHFSVGFQKLKQTNTTSNTSWTPSDITSGNDLSLTSHNTIRVAGSNLTAGHDLSIDGSSVMFDALSQTGKQTQSSKMFSVGLSLGLSSDSVAGQALQSALAASQASGKDSGTLKTLTAIEGANKATGGMSAALTAPPPPPPKGSDGKSNGQDGLSKLNVAGVEASLGVNKSSSYAEQNQSTVQGASLSAGRDLTITARGPSDGDKAGGSIDITGAQLAAQNVVLNAEKGVALKAGWDSTSSLSRSKSSSMSVGAEVNVTAAGGVAGGINASGQMQKQHGNSDSKTAVDTVVNASQAARINAPGATNLNGAEIHAKRIDVNTGQLSITSPQNISDYESKASQTSAGGSIGTSASEWGASGGYTKQTIRDHFVSTGKTLSGLYGGSDGVGVDVAGDTTLKAGVISSTADASKNHLTTGDLDAENEENSSIWSLVSTGGQGGIGAGMLGSSLGTLGQLAKNMAGNSLGMLGGGRAHDEHSVSPSAISGNITVQARSQSGHYLTDVSKANGALNNNFDAQKLQNQMQASQVGMRLVGETIGTVSQRLSDAGVPGFSETTLSDSWARTLLEAGGNAGIAALTGGNVGAAAAGSVLGNVAATASRDAVASFASGLTGNKSDGTQTLANAISSVIASGAGAAGGLVAGGGNARFNALNGAAAASALEQYNAEEHMTVHGHRHPKKSIFPLSRGAVHTILGGLSMVPVVGVSTFASAVLVGMDLSEGNYGEAALDSIGLVPLAGAAVKEVVFAGKAAMAARAVEGARDAQKVEEGTKEAVLLRKGEKKTAANDNTPPDGGSDESSIPPSSEQAAQNNQHKWVHDQGGAANDNYDAANDNGALTADDQQPMVVNGSRGSRSRNGSINKRGSTDYSSSQGGNTSMAEKGGGRGGIPQPDPVEVEIDGEKFLYKSNPKHTPGSQGSNPTAGKEPLNSLELFERSFPGKERGGNNAVRYAVDENGAIHRFFATKENGTGMLDFHWSGSTVDARNPLTMSNLRKDMPIIRNNGGKGK